MKNAQKLQLKIAKELGTRFFENIERVKNLLMLFGYLEKTTVENTNFNKRTNLDDILRSYVVLLHANLEDYLRNLAKITWIAKDSEFYDAIPIFRENRKKNAEKFLLREIAKHKGKSVNTLLKNSLFDYVENNLTFNDTGQISSHLLSCNAFNENCRKSLKKIDSFLKRRHRIVHHADKSLNSKHRFSSISRKQVEGWLFCVRDIVTESLMAHTEYLRTLNE